MPASRAVVRRPSRRALLGLAGASALAGAAVLPAIGLGTRYQWVRRSGPDRTDALLDGVVVATFTDGARTVALKGRARTFTEPGVTAVVRHSTWVRLAPYTWTQSSTSSSWVGSWLDRQRINLGPDLLAMAMQYVAGASDATDDSGLRYRGNASYGPLTLDDRIEGSDVEDYLGTSWTYVDGVTRTGGSDRYGAVDCSGYVRLLLGRRLGYPLLSSYKAGPGLPRRSRDMAAFAPGALLIPDTGVRPTDLRALAPGDLLFFDTDNDTDTTAEFDGIINHVAIYLGLDDSGRRRFVSSRKSIDGPTMGDYKGASLLDGTGLYARGFRSARRI
ncbi:NlpC/P60 family protein [Luteipulveratus sp. YIM 133132]|uniref:NlpC/P60 family protein n=1 Tax=Luteipulveratus flavus TaxID=3031728 RepID=A0ABT6CAM5_9MICO|nr:MULTISPECIES: NlpC/P60 family protein [unclassified Luteipulveratus]MDE9365929.1 NlpC/P60 family protein [Luteipulveratus sp. YIM 133132]MDF8265119.1 NlpC/P60 family protein [Luteipulveratus sp. YIM 133296]